MIKGKWICLLKWPGNLVCWADMGEVIDLLIFYNYKRFSSTLCYISLMQFKQDWLAAQLKEVAKWAC